MHIGRQEWQQLAAQDAAAPARTGPLKALYQRLADARPDEATRTEAADFLREEVLSLRDAPAELPERPEDLLAWMEENALSVHARYGEYLRERREGAPRRFFSSRAHALYVLRCVAPTKLVDGSWLYGLMPHWRNPRLSDLVRTYVEELGEGAPDKNHVVLYRRLLAAHALDPLDGLDDALYRQGLVQLALAWNAEAFLPEVVGFNLAYEQLPLHLLITAYELNELGIDPYYFTLHVTVDNAGTGHARRACQAALDLLPRLEDGGAFWQRMRDGAKLACAGLGTTAVVQGFDAHREVVRILAHKAAAGSGAHSDYCKVAGRSVNEWLRDPHGMAGFLHALQEAGWIRPGEAFAWHARLIEERGADYDPRVISRIRRGATMSAAAYLELLAERRRWIAAVAQRLAAANADTMVMPTVPVVAPRIADLEADDELYGKTNLLVLRNPTFINFLDGCALSVPCHRAGDAPVGLMLAAAGGHDARLLALGAAVEAVLAGEAR